jgi:VCBS repeat-containing protein
LIASNALTFTGTPSSDAGTPQTIAWTYSGTADLDFLRAGQHLTLTFPVTVGDGDATSNAQTITVTIIGTNDAPVAAADTNATDAVIEAGDQPLVGDATAVGNVLTNDTDADQTETLSLTVTAATLTGI